MLIYLTELNRFPAVNTIFDEFFGKSYPNRATEDNMRTVWPLALLSRGIHGGFQFSTDRCRDCQLFTREPADAWKVRGVTFRFDCRVTGVDLTSYRARSSPAIAAQRPSCHLHQYGDRPR